MSVLELLNILNNMISKYNDELGIGKDLVIDIARKWYEIGKSDYASNDFLNQYWKPKVIDFLNMFDFKSLLRYME